MDISSLQAARAYGQNTTGKSTGSGDTVTAAKNVVSDFSEVMKSAENTAAAAMTSRADPHALVEALANSQFAVETAVTVRDRVVEAYQEILRMPV